MSLDYAFFVETRRSGVWTTPPGFEGGRYASQRLGRFAWLPPQSPAADLFFGDAALLRFRYGIPKDRADSAMFRYLDTFYDYAANEYAISWLPYPELLVDLWDEPSLLLEAKVPVRLASLFTAGRGPFPERELSERGCLEPELNDLRRGQATRITRLPRDRVHGLGRFELEAAVAGARLPVTWTASVAELLGAERADAFRRLREYGSDEELRVLSWYS